MCHKTCMVIMRHVLISYTVIEVFGQYSLRDWMVHKTPSCLFAGHDTGAIAIKTTTPQATNAPKAQSARTGSAGVVAHSSCALLRWVLRDKIRGALSRELDRTTAVWFCETQKKEKYTRQSVDMDAPLTR